MTEDEELNEMIQTVIRRYNQRFPEWEILFISIPKKEGRREAVTELIEFLKKYL